MSFMKASQFDYPAPSAQRRNRYIPNKHTMNDKTRYGIGMPTIPRGNGIAISGIRIISLFNAFFV